ncbi:signal-induced proliferation-associated 1-like protein 2 [Rhinophrynus dorsalis]
MDDTGVVGIEAGGGGGVVWVTFPLGNRSRSLEMTASTRARFSFSLNLGSQSPPPHRQRFDDSPDCCSPALPALAQASREATSLEGIPVICIRLFRTEGEAIKRSRSRKGQKRGNRPSTHAPGRPALLRTEAAIRGDRPPSQALEWLDLYTKGSSEEDSSGDDKEEREYEDVDYSYSYGDFYEVDTLPSAVGIIRAVVQALQVSDTPDECPSSTDVFQKHRKSSNAFTNSKVHEQILLLSSGFCSYLHFAFDSEHYQFTTLPFGLASAPRVFTRVMGALTSFSYTGYSATGCSKPSVKCRGVLLLAQVVQAAVKAAQSDLRLGDQKTLDNDQINWSRPMWPAILEVWCPSPSMECEVIRDSEENLERTKQSEAKLYASSKILTSYQQMGLQKESNVKISPNKHSQNTDKSPSSHSSSNTLSSNTSSNSDDKHFRSGDFMDPELLGLTYMKGASTDSGIDTTPCCMPTQVTASVHHSGSRSGSQSISDKIVQWDSSSEGTEGHSNMYSLFGCSGHAAIESFGDLTELSPHSSLYSEGDTATLMQLQDSVIDTETESQHVQKMVPDSPIIEEVRKKFSVFGTLSPRRSLHRTVSDESICSNRRRSSYASSHSSILEQVLPNDILFSTTPPYHNTLPHRSSLNSGMGSLRRECWFSDSSLSDNSKFSDPCLIPLPNTAIGLDWSHLVDAARTFEDQHISSFCTVNEMQQAQELKKLQESSLCSGYINGKDFGDPPGQRTPTILTGRVIQLEMILRQLQTDLLKEKEDKALLQAEVHHLRQHNIRLQEESQTASAQLRKFTEWFFSSVDKKS